MDRKQAKQEIATATAAAIGARVRAYREERGYSMGELAQFCGLSKETIRATESGEQAPRIETMMRLSRSLGVDLDDLLPDGWRETYAPGAWLSLPDGPKGKSRSSRTGKSVQGGGGKGKRPSRHHASSSKYSETGDDQDEPVLITAVRR